MNIGGWKAISLAHGWSITIVGMSTVFIGLIGICVFILILNKLFSLQENFSFSGLLLKFPLTSHKSSQILDPQVREDAEKIYLLSKYVGGEFSLESILNLAQKRGVTISKKSIEILLKKGILTQSGENTYKLRKL